MRRLLQAGKQSSFGVSHQAFNKTELSELMAISADDKSIKEALAILDEFNLSNLPPSNFAKGKAEELANTWNAKQGVSIVTAKEQLLDDGKEVAMDAEGAWTLDRQRQRGTSHWLEDEN